MRKKWLQFDKGQCQKSEVNTPLLLIVLLPQFGSCWKSVRESCLDKCVVDGWDRMFTWSTCWTNLPAILSWSSVTRVLIPSVLHWCCVILDSQLFHYTARCHRWVSCWFPRMPMNVTCDAFHSESFPCQCCSGPRGTIILFIALYFHYFFYPISSTILAYDHTSTPN